MRHLSTAGIVPNNPHMTFHFGDTQLRRSMPDLLRCLNKAFQRLFCIEKGSE